MRWFYLKLISLLIIAFLLVQLANNVDALITLIFLLVVLVIVYKFTKYREAVKAKGLSDEYVKLLSKANAEITNTTALIKGVRTYNVEYNSLLPLTRYYEYYFETPHEIKPTNLQGLLKTSLGYHALRLKRGNCALVYVKKNTPLSEEELTSIINSLTLEETA